MNTPARERSNSGRDMSKPLPDFRPTSPTQHAVGPANHGAGQQTDTSTPHTTPSDLTQLFEAMLSRDKVDAVYDPTVMASRRRIEYPSLNDALVKNFRAWEPDRPYPPGNAIKEEAVQLVTDELTKCDTTRPLGGDYGIFEEVHFQTAHEPPWDDALKALYWRGRVQNAILDVFNLLTTRGHLQPNCLKLPVNFYSISRPVASLAHLLHCYEGPQKERHLDPAPFEYYDDRFTAPLYWLAAMILRGLCADITSVFETITRCGFLGRIDEKAFQRWCEFSDMKHFQINPNEMAASVVGHADFGLWLPHGLGDGGNDDDGQIAKRLRKHVDRFNRVERVFCEFFQIPREEIGLESEQ